MKLYRGGVKSNYQLIGGIKLWAKRKFLIRHLLAVMTAIALILCWLRWLDPDLQGVRDILSGFQQEFRRVTPLPDATNCPPTSRNAAVLLGSMFGGGCGLMFDTFLVVLSVSFVMKVAGIRSFWETM